MEHNLLTLDGFINRYFQLCRESKTNFEAYLKVAAEYREKYGIDRYSGYDSFRKVKNRKLKKK